MREAPKSEGWAFGVRVHSARLTSRRIGGGHLQRAVTMMTPFHEIGLCEEPHLGAIKGTSTIRTGEQPSSMKRKEGLGKKEEPKVLLQATNDTEDCRKVRGVGS